MKKNALFLIAMIAVTALLFLLRKTGMAVHIAVSLLGLAVMIPYTLKTRGGWEKPALEVLMRVMYLVAVVTGGMLMKLHGVAALGVVHKIGAAVFAVLLLVLYIPQIRK